MDPAREAAALLGGERHRGAGDEAGDAGRCVQREDERVAPEDRQQVGGVRRFGQSRQVDRRQVRRQEAGDDPDGAEQGQRDRQAECRPAAQDLPAPPAPTVQRRPRIPHAMREDVFVGGRHR